MSEEEVVTGTNAYEKVYDRYLPEELTENLVSVEYEAVDEEDDLEVDQVAERNSNIRSTIDSIGTVSPDQCAMKLLYENCFAVNLKRGSTPGGAITHEVRNNSFSYTEDLHGNVEGFISDIKGQDESLFHYPINTVLSMISSLGFNFIVRFIRSAENFGKTSMTRSALGDVESFIHRTNNPRALYNRASNFLEPGWDAVRFQYFYQEELFTEVSDEELLREFDLGSGIKVIDAYTKAYDFLRSKGNGAIDQSGFIAGETDPEYANALRKLAVLRNSPDLSFLFEYGTVRSAINARLKERGKI